MAAVVAPWRPWRANSWIAASSTCARCSSALRRGVDADCDRDLASAGGGRYDGHLPVAGADGGRGRMGAWRAASSVTARVSGGLCRRVLREPGPRLSPEAGLRPGCGQALPAWIGPDSSDAMPVYPDTSRATAACSWT